MVAAALVLAVGKADARDERIVALEKTFMSPCCWSQTAHDHKSGAAADMRKRIRAYVAEGLSDEEIATRFVEEYGKRILAMPEAEGFDMAAYVLPVVFPAIGAAVLAAYLRSRSRQGGRVGGAAAELKPEQRAILDRALAERET